MVEADSKVAVTPRSVVLVVQKASPGPFWGKLVKGKAPHNVKVDWSKWKDEDEEDEPAAAGARAGAEQLSSRRLLGRCRGGLLTPVRRRAVPAAPRRAPELCY